MYIKLKNKYIGMYEKWGWKGLTTHGIDNSFVYLLKVAHGVQLSVTSTRIDERIDGKIDENYGENWGENYGEN